MSNKPLLQQLIDAFQCLPGVGRKSAQRMVYHLLERDRGGALKLAKIIEHAMHDITHCQRCRDYTEEELCVICSNPRRDDSIICVVESPADIAAIESSSSYSGRYFVLMGHLSPIDGIGPEELALPQLKEMVMKTPPHEVIVATSATVEGESTAHFIADMLKQVVPQTRVTRLAQGVPMGGELGYLDQSTLAMSLSNRREI